MKRGIWVLALLIAAASAKPASAQLLFLGTSTSTSTTTTTTTTTTAGSGGVIVRTTLGPLGLNLVCLLNGCTVVGNLDGEIGRAHV